jgi:Mrp family chromosome partitioning ATPase
VDRALWGKAKEMLGSTRPNWDSHEEEHSRGVLKWVTTRLKKLGRQPGQQPSTSFRFLAQRIGRDLPVTDKGHVVTLSSLVHPHVASDTTLMLAWYLASELECRILLVDAGYRENALTRRLGHDGAKGVDNLASDDAALDELTIPVADGVALLPCGTLQRGVAVPFAAERVTRLLQQARDAFDYVIVQHGRVDSDSRFLSFAEQADLLLLVVEEGRTKTSDIEASQNILSDHGIRKVGLLLTKAGQGTSAFDTASKPE